MHSGLKFLTPCQRHNGESDEIISHRDKVYQVAKAKHPERWSRSTSNWFLNETVYLNPQNENKKIEKIS